MKRRYTGAAALESHVDWKTLKAGVSSNDDQDDDRHPTRPL